MMVELNKEFNLSDIYFHPENFTELLKEPGYLIYRIHNHVTDKSYIGDTEVNLKWRLFQHCPGAHFKKYDYSTDHLYNSMRLYGLDKFFISIIYIGIYDEDLEEKYISYFDSYYSGYNNSPHGKPFHRRSVCLGRVRVTNGEEDRIIPPHLLPEFLSNGYWRGMSYGTCSDTKWVCKGGLYKRVPSELLNEFLKDGYLNESPLLGLIIMSNDSGQLIRVHPDLIKQYESDGWVIGKPSYTWMNDGKDNYQIPNSEVLNHPELFLGRTYQPNLRKRYVHNDEYSLMADEEFVEEYLADGFELGSGYSPCSGYIWVHKKDELTRVPEDQLNNYLDDGWELGLNYSSTEGLVTLNNGTSIIKVSPEEVESYQKAGWNLGQRLNCIDVQGPDGHIEDCSLDNRHEFMYFVKKGYTHGGIPLEQTKYYSERFEYPSYVYRQNGTLLSKYDREYEETGTLTLSPPTTIP